MQNNKFYKENPSDLVWWVDTSDQDGLFLFSFDKERCLTCLLTTHTN